MICICIIHTNLFHHINMYIYNYIHIYLCIIFIYLLCTTLISVLMSLQLCETTMIEHLHGFSAGNLLQDLWSNMVTTPTSIFQALGIDRIMTEILWVDHPSTDGSTRCRGSRWAVRSPQKFTDFHAACSKTREIPMPVCSMKCISQKQTLPFHVCKYHKGFCE